MKFWQLVLIMLLASSSPFGKTSLTVDTALTDYFLGREGRMLFHIGLGGTGPFGDH